MIKSMKSPRRLAAVAVFAIVAMSAFGFAATNTFPDGGGTAGDGQGAISGGAVTNIEYDVTGSNIVGVSFDYSAEAANVRVALKSLAVAGSDLAVANTADCTVTIGVGTTNFDCTFIAPASVAASNGIQVTTWN